MRSRCAGVRAGLVTAFLTGSSCAAVAPVSGVMICGLGSFGKVGGASRRWVHSLKLDKTLYRK